MSHNATRSERFDHECVLIHFVFVSTAATCSGAPRRGAATGPAGGQKRQEFSRLLHFRPQGRIYSEHLGNVKMLGRIRS